MSAPSHAGRISTESIAQEQPFDLESVRSDFPILAMEIHGKPLAYLDNAATSQKPRSVIDALSNYYEHTNANIHRGVHSLSERATTAYENARSRIGRWIHTPAEDYVIFVRGTTEGINLVAQSYARPRLRAGDEILITQMEHHSNIVPWQLVCEQTGAVLRVAPIDERGALEIDQLESKINDKTKIVAITHVSNALGTINDVKPIVEMAHRAGAIVLVDGAQAVSHMNVNVAELDCDFYAFSAHKLFGPTGVGVLYGKAALLDEMTPYQGGGEMIKSVTFDKTLYADLPYKFEAGTPNIAGAIGMGAAIEYLEQLDFAGAQGHEMQLHAYMVERLKTVPGLTLIGTAEHQTSVQSFTMDCAHPHDLGTVLDDQGVAVRTGHHCAQPVLEKFGVSATTRASLAFYNTREEVDQLILALGRVIEVFG